MSIPLYPILHPRTLSALHRESFIPSHALQPLMPMPTTRSTFSPSVSFPSPSKLPSQAHSGREYITSTLTSSIGHSDQALHQPSQSDSFGAYHNTVSLAQISSLFLARREQAKMESGGYSKDLDLSQLRHADGVYVCM